jgi:amidophosphoribosyltransferase
MATKTEFIATNRSTEEIAREIGVDHLVYLDRDAMNEAAHAGNPKIEKFCNACFTGEYPTGDVTREMLMAIEGERCSAQNAITADAAQG